MVFPHPAGGHRHPLQHRDALLSHRPETSVSQGREVQKGGTETLAVCARKTSKGSGALLFFSQKGAVLFGDVRPARGRLLSESPTAGHEETGGCWEHRRRPSEADTARPEGLRLKNKHAHLICSSPEYFSFGILPRKIKSPGGPGSPKFQTLQHFLA